MGSIWEWSLRRGLALVLLASAGAFVTAAPEAGAASVTIGGVNTAPADLDSDNACSECRLFQGQTGTGSPSYSVPPGSWAVTSWRTATGAPPYGEGTPHVLFVDADGSSGYTLAIDRAAPTPLAPSQVNEYDADFHVRGGWLLGIQTGFQPAARSGNTAGDVICSHYGSAVCESTGLLNIEATLEADGDADGFGDDTRDPCPNGMSSGPNIDGDGCFNPEDPDVDGDGILNADDPDDDGDSVDDAADACPIGAGSGVDTDADGCFNAEDGDDDGDGVPDASDGCPTGAGSGPDTDGDGCKNAGEDSDDDGDGVPDGSDDCPQLEGSAAGCPDSDGDGVADKTDECPGVAGAPANEGCPVNPEDTVPPQGTITRAKVNSPRRKATFEFSSSEGGSTYRCKLDRSRFKKCAPPRTYRRLKVGRHTFKVRAVDRAGNVDPSAAVSKFRIRR